MASEGKKGYRDSVNLPQTDFPMKAGLAQKEPRFQQQWDEMDLYGMVRSARAGAEKYILHDGPPYPTGELHIGTGLNKILKDVIVRYQTMRGYDAPYIPGWDCHGLPIEHRVLRNLGGKARKMSITDIRLKCRRSAEKYVDIQRGQFKRLGIMGDWERPYLTLDPTYEAGILEVFARMVERGYITRSLKSTHWCMNCATVLAEAEIVYADEPSPSIFVNFPMVDDVRDLFPQLTEDDDVHVLIWTTTPWTLPANRAVAIAARAEYVAVRYTHPVKGEKVVSILAADLAERVLDKIGARDVEMLNTVKGQDLEGRTYRHCILDMTGPFVLAGYVSLDEGTGCVHTAPGHGQDDYVTGIKCGLEIASPVNGNGVFTEEAGPFSGQHITKAQADIIAFLRESGALLLHEEFSHSYPHCWRCDKPVIFRATEQWFVKVDHDQLRDKALAAVREVRWIPESGQARIAGMITDRPDWCLSRQRVWGVPIPAFYCHQCGEVLLTAENIRAVGAIFAEEGSESWFAQEASHFLPGATTCAKCGSAEFEKETDIFDVWLEAGSSHHSVVQRHPALRFPADMYLEGSDQHRGWFQLSLLPCLAGQGVAPFRTVLTHGFVVDDHGRKMSKSKGNFISVADAIKDFPSDILRLWTVSTDYRQDMNVSRELIGRATESYRRIRNTLKYLLGNLGDFDPETNRVAPEDMEEIDRWALAALHGLLTRTAQAFDDFSLYRVYNEIHHFCAVDMSAFYLDVVKDRLYCNATDSRDRRSVQTVLHEVLGTLVRMCAPALVHTAEEAWSHMDHREDLPSVHLARWPEADPSWEDDALLQRWARLMKVRGDVLREIERLRAEKVLRGSLEASVTLGTADADLRAFLDTFAERLDAIFIVSEVKLASEAIAGGVEGTDEPALTLAVELCAHPKCERCWRLHLSVGQSPDHATLCQRCVGVIEAMGAES